MDKNYSTKQRDEIIEFFRRHGGCCYTAKEIIKTGELKAGEATVYRTLARLTEKGVIKRYSGDGLGAVYRLNENESCSKHFHLKCGSCGRIFHIDCVYMADIKRHIENEHGFFVDPGKTVFYGICGECAKKRLQNKEDSEI